MACDKTICRIDNDNDKAPIVNPAPQQQSTQQQDNTMYDQGNQQQQ